MKRIIQISVNFLAVIILVTGCTVVNKTAGVDRSKFVGTWTITSVTYEGILGNAVSKVFDQASPNAFVGSTWQLTNSGNAVYTLTDGTAQSIYWSYYNPGAGEQSMFQFKKVYQGDKVKNIDSGYRLVIANIDNSSMTLKVPVNADGRAAYVVYSFIKK
ncbi:hypothetical protein BDD43_5561 [Mucilaginibacter gracilis]|uniref:Uncharacterized protein n=1 Tax=Mucilaginibacter gracilis TaxID=423350 RepID=A0A495J8S8_9SPHI|nr:lipocalin family protein [Mucilaginibacter gracilis]RKR85297.1 hypothetical protein BDD43_5561 [Mucilaginibacter gracilis]